MRARFLILAAAFFASTAALAQLPDCTGVSGVRNSDPDLFGELDTVQIASGLNRPVFVTGVPGDDSRLFFVEKRGLIRIIKDGALNTTPFLDIDSIVTGGTSNNNEQGLLSMAFHPDYQNNGYFYVYYTATSPAGAVNIARYERMTDDLANPGSGTTLLTISQPAVNHNGGKLEFGPDGALYAGVGDGGSFCDPGSFPGYAQNLNSLLGKILRLDVDAAFPYSTAGNPFDGPTTGRDEIWHYGLRNPWRWSFDLETGAMLIGDVGQNLREELNCVPAGTSGANFGWNAYEGFSCDTCGEWPAPTCPDLTDYVPPFDDYSLSGAPCSVIGGHAYRGCRMPDLRGTYFYSDFCSPFINTVPTDGACGIGSDTNRASDLIPASGGTSIGSIVSYGQDNQGEMYIVDQGVSALTGEIFKIVPDISIVEVSGPGAAVPLTIGSGGEFAWEDLEDATGIPLRFYKIYRADTFDPQSGFGTFDCIHRQAATQTSWGDGDTDDPASGDVFYYLVTAQRLTTFVEGVAGADSSGNLRTVDSAGSCN